MKPNVVGPKILYLNPSTDRFTTAEIALIDTNISATDIKPYAYTATVRDDYDAFNFATDDAGSTLVPSVRVAWGLFLSPQNEKGNLLFQLSGKAHFTSSLTGGLVSGGFFFGRKATNNTVTSSKAGTANTLDKFIILPSNSQIAPNVPGLIADSIQSEIFTLAVTGGYVYCFGYFLQNGAGSNTTLLGKVDLAIRKWTEPINVFTP